MKISIQKLNPNAIVPKPATSGRAGCDLHACITETITIQPGETVKIPTGLAIALPTNKLAAFVFARSGLGIKHNITPANCVGVIDSEYRGELIVGLQNHSTKAFTVEPNDRIAQLVIMPVEQPEFEEVSSLDETERGQGGFGSTGTK